MVFHSPFNTSDDVTLEAPTLITAHLADQELNPWSHAERTVDGLTIVERRLAGTSDDSSYMGAVTAAINHRRVGTKIGRQSDRINELRMSCIDTHIENGDTHTLAGQAGSLHHISAHLGIGKQIRRAERAILNRVLYGRRGRATHGRSMACLAAGGTPLLFRRLHRCVILDDNALLTLIA